MAENPFYNRTGTETGSWILAELRLKSQTMDNQYYIVANVIETSKIESAAEYRFMSRAKFSIKNDRVREEIIRYIFEEAEKNASAEWQ